MQPPLFPFPMRVTLPSPFNVLTRTFSSPLPTRTATGGRSPPSTGISPPLSPVAVAAKVISMEESVLSTARMKEAAEAIALEDRELTSTAAAAVAATVDDITPRTRESDLSQVSTRTIILCPYKRRRWLLC